MTLGIGNTIRGVTKGAFKITANAGGLEAVSDALDLGIVAEGFSTVPIVAMGLGAIGTATAHRQISKLHEDSSWETSATKRARIECEINNVKCARFMGLVGFGLATTALVFSIATLGVGIPVGGLIIGSVGIALTLWNKRRSGLAGQRCKTEEAKMKKWVDKHKESTQRRMERIAGCSIEQDGHFLEGRN